jgi:hydrogenase-4 membrane subunit HyfE
MLFRVFYYYYYLFYKRVLKDDEPHLLTTLTLSFSESIVVNAAIDIIAVKTSCYSVGKWPMLTVLLLIFLANFLLYHRTTTAKQLVKEKPAFNGSHILSIILTWIFFPGNNILDVLGAIICKKHIR